MSDMIVSEELKEPLQRAMMLFWEKGVEATSYPEIVAATRLSRKALYSNWADKAALVRDALALYRYDTLAPMLGALSPPSAASLRVFWDRMDQATKSDGWSGCFLFRSASGELRGDPFVQETFRGYVDELRARFADCIRQGITSGEIAATVDPEMASWQAISVISLMSAFGGQTGNGPEVQALLASGRRACGF